MVESDRAAGRQQDVASGLMESTIDEYVAICKAVARSVGFSTEEHEVSQKLVVLRGRLSGRAAMAVSPIPSLRIPRSLLHSIVRTSEKKGLQVILLSPFEDDGMPPNKIGLAASRTGSEFIAAAMKTNAYRDFMNRLESGDDAARSRSERKSSELMKYARERYDAGDYREALATLASVLSARPHWDEAFRLDGNIHLKMKEYDRALTSFDAAVRWNPGNADNWFGKATTLYLLGRYEEELRCYQSILRIRPSHLGALQNMGVTLQEMGKLKEATIAYERLLRLKKNDTGVMKNLAIARYRMGDLDGALKVLDGVLAVNRDEPRALRMKGLILAEQEKKEALEYLTRYASMEKDDDVTEVIASLRKKLGAELQPPPSAPVEVEGQPEKDQTQMEDVQAVPSLPARNAPAPATVQKEPEPVAMSAAEAVGEEPQLVRKMREAGLLHDDDGLVRAVKFLSCIGNDEARGAALHISGRLERSISEEDATPKVASLIEKTAFARGDYAKAERIARRLASAAPNASNSKRLVADLAMLRRYADALRQLGGWNTPMSQAVETSLQLAMWKHGKAMNSIKRQKRAAFLLANNNGIVILQRKGPEDAVDYYEKAGFRTAAMENNEGVCLRLTGELKKGLEMLQQGASAGRWQYTYNLGVTLIETGHEEEAAEVLRASIAQNDSGIARNSLGVALASMKDYEAARIEFEAALRADPPCEVARRNLRKLDVKA